MEDPYAFSIMLALKKSFKDFRELDESKGSRYSEWFVTTRDGHSAITKAIDLNMLDAVKYIVSKQKYRGDYHNGHFLHNKKLKCYHYSKIKKNGHKA